jgi:hypothetical protein
MIERRIFWGNGRFNRRDRTHRQTMGLRNTFSYFAVKCYTAIVDYVSISQGRVSVTEFREA